MNGTESLVRTLVTSGVDTWTRGARLIEVEL